MNQSKNITGIILAGGKNQRMGQNKALVLWRGKRMIDWVFQAINPLCADVIISSNEILEPPGKVLFVKDRYINIGPVAGIESGLHHSNSETNIIVSCDSPLVSTEFFTYLLDQHADFEISIPIHNGVNEPMIGIYERSVLPVFQAAIKRGLNKPPAIIKSCKYQEVEISDKLNFYRSNLFLNLNNPEDLKNSENEKN